MSRRFPEICNFFLTFDILSNDVRLTVGGRDHIPSKLGTCLSFVSILVFGLLSYISITSYFDTSNPKITTERSAIATKPLIDMKKNSHYPILFFVENDAKYLRWEVVQQYVHVNFLHIVYLPRADGTDETVRTYLKIVPCKELMAREGPDAVHIEGEGFVKTYYKELGFCIDDEGRNITLGGPTNDNFYEALYLELFPCTLTDGSCKSAQEMKQLAFLASNPAASMNVGNYRQPFKYMAEDIAFQGIIPDLFQMRSVYVLPNKIVEDRGFLSGKKVTHSFTSIQKDETKLISRDRSQMTCRDPVVPACTPYFLQSILLSNTQVTTIREYRGVVETVGEIGGTTKAVIAVFSMLYNLYYQVVRKRQLVRIIYGLADRSKSVPEALTERLKHDLDILRLVREVKLLKLLVRTLLPPETRVQRGELEQEDLELTQYVLELPTGCPANAQAQASDLISAGAPKSAGKTATSVAYQGFSQPALGENQDESREGLNRVFPARANLTRPPSISSRNRQELQAEPRVCEHQISSLRDLERDKFLNDVPDKDRSSRFF